MNADIQQSIGTMPEYQEPLNFLQGVLDFQAALAEKIEPNLGIEPSEALVTWQTGQFLLADNSIAISPILFRKALSDLRPILPPNDPAQMTLDRVLDSSLLMPSNVESLLDELVTDSESCLEHIANTTFSDPATVLFLFQIVLSPFYERQAAPYQYSVETAVWRRGICPICGSEPGMARLTDDHGRRLLVCTLCRTEWSFDRLRCPFCEGVGQPQLRHFIVGDDEAHRVDCCDRCRRYIKTVDERVTGAATNLLIEDVITTHLDSLAQEQGYR